MADILIKLDKGIPKTYESLVIDKDNEVRVYGTDVVIGEAIELPPHGTLKDTDAFLAEYAPKTTTIHVVIDGKTLSIKYPLKEILRPLFDAPTVLEASE